MVSRPERARHRHRSWAVQLLHGLSQSCTYPMGYDEDLIDLPSRLPSMKTALAAVRGVISTIFFACI